MSHVLPPEPDDEFDTFMSDVVDGVELDIAAEGPTPDLAAVVALAHQMDDNRVGASAVDEVSAYAPVVTLDQGRRFRQTREDLELDVLCEQVRAQVDQEVARELSQAAPKPESRPTPRYWWVGVLVAAALVVGIGIGTLQATQLFENDHATDQNAALHSDREDESDTHTVEHHEPAARPPLAPTPEPEAAPDEDDVELVPEVEDEAVETASRRKRRHKSKPKEVAAPVETLDEKLKRLDGEAHAAWKRGQLDKADKLFAEIARLDKRGRLAGLAINDRVTIAGQRGQKGRQAQLWRAYLKRFPRGRFADDARADLCRRMSGDALVECWTAYLADMPRGSYRAQARRAIGDGGTR